MRSVRHQNEQSESLVCDPVRRLSDRTACARSRTMFCCMLYQSMAATHEYRCEVCGTKTNNPSHWFVIQCGASQLTVLRWDAATADAAGARHYCGEAHAQVYRSEEH